MRQAGRLSGQHAQAGEVCCLAVRPGRRLFVHGVSVPSDEENTVIPSLGVARMILEQNVAILSVDATADERFAKHDSVQLQSIRSVMCAPMGSKDRVWGVCYADHLTPEKAFDDEALDLMAAVARQAGLALENMYLLEEQRRSIESFI